MVGRVKEEEEKSEQGSGDIVLGRYGPEWAKSFWEVEQDLLGQAHGLKPPTLARRHSNYLHELFYDRRSW